MMGFTPVVVGVGRRRDKDEEARRQLEADLAEIDREYAIVSVLYRRADGTEASVSCANVDLERQLKRIAERGYTVLNISR